MCKECEKKAKKLNKIAGFIIHLDNEAYDRGMENTIKPIVNEIMKIINRK